MISFHLGSKDCVSFYDCFRMICAFDHGSLVKDVVNRMKANNIDEKWVHWSAYIVRWLSNHFYSRKLVQYCVLKGYLRRVREYRVSLDDSPIQTNNGYTQAPETNAESNEINSLAKYKLRKKLREVYDGTNDTDSLACMNYSKWSSVISEPSHFLLVSNTRQLPTTKRNPSNFYTPNEAYITLWKWMYFLFSLIRRKK